MVNLTGPNEQAARAMGERGSLRGPLPPRNHHNWGAGFGRRRYSISKEPATLSQLEHLALKSANLMNKHGGQPEHNFQIAMDLLRQQYNMNFMVVCEKCKRPHMCDEIIAPER